MMSYLLSLSTVRTAAVRTLSATVTPKRANSDSSAAPAKNMDGENPGGNAYDDNTKALILAAYYERFSLRGLSRTFGVSRNTVAAWLKDDHQKSP